MTSILKSNSIYTISFSLLLILIGIAGCTPAQDIIYLEDIQPNVTMNIQDPRPIKLLPGDRVYISVHSRDKELVEMFNLTTPGGGGNSGGGNGQCSYTVDDNGKIEMPIIGSIHVKGLSRLELQNIIRYKLLASKLVRDPIVNVEFVDVGYYVIGEMGAGKHEISRDKVTLLEAIAESGDLTINGRRDNILVLRTNDGQQTPYRVNLTSTADVYSSPVYYLQQNDVIYVEPNETKINQASPNGNGYRTPAFWIGMFNFALSLVFLFTRI